ncbi:acetyl-CoA acetyltransferases [Desulfocicer vacuolatum DSM 3385]|uniref:Acetyl-CoA acetyltransferases n=1 Tax=Desulfocicer vacuolatum DSM 3385 TaxID=1121400 RepID=A0A1W2D5M8_9BACT|nr:thiolase family protein [Desulfocicer vacuolatum]SMC92840.1 acetyl-CoA acetyltransferases [Desulfocicer vacuolatum DSM 3385]
MKEVYIVSAVRTPVGKQKGYLREWEAPRLLATVLDASIKKIDLDPNLVDDVITGCVYQVGEQGFTLARMGVLASDILPETIPGIAINRQCGSSLSAIQMAHGMIASGNMDVVIASGCELMSKYTMLSDVNGTLYTKQPMGNPWGKLYMERFGAPNQIVAAQKIADTYGITKEACQELAVQSHQKAHRANSEGYFKNEIVPMKGLDKEGNEIIRDTDEPVRPQTTFETLDGLKPLPGTEWLTAGLSSTITDGSSSIILMGEDKVKELNLTPLARIVANTVVGSDPRLMLTGPLPATKKILDKSGMTLDDMDIYEINEAFAPIPLAWEKVYDADREKLNVNGGALALGHPVGNSGCRLSVSAIHELHRRKGKYALVSLCTGGGMAPATIFERV